MKSNLTFFSLLHQTPLTFDESFTQFTFGGVVYSSSSQNAVIYFLEYGKQHKSMFLNATRYFEQQQIQLFEHVKWNRNENNWSSRSNCRWMGWCEFSERCTYNEYAPREAEHHPLAMLFALSFGCALLRWPRSSETIYRLYINRQESCRWNKRTFFCAG